MKKFIGMVFGDMLFATASAALLGLVAVAGCMNGPVNGSVYDGDGGTTTQQMVNFYGFYGVPNHTIIVQVLTNPTWDPNNDANWTEIPVRQRTHTGSTPYYYNDSTPMYYWTL